MLKWVMGLGLFMVLAACSTSKMGADQPTENTAAKKASLAKINTQLGMAYLERHEVQRAKQKLLTAMKEGPNVPEVWYSMGYFLEVTGEPKKAKDHYLKAIAIAPNRGDTHNNYGTFLCRTGEYNEAIQQFMLAIQDANYLDTASAYENAGLCATKIPDRKRAIAYFKQAIGQDPNRVASLNALTQLGVKTKA